MVGTELMLLQGRASISVKAMQYCCRRMAILVKEPCSNLSEMYAEGKRHYRLKMKGVFEQVVNM